MRCLEKEISEIEKLSDEPCTCTPDQQEGKDFTVCKSCEASYLINELGEDMRQGLGRLRGKK